MRPALLMIGAWLVAVGVAAPAARAEPPWIDAAARTELALAGVAYVRAPPLRAGPPGIDAETRRQLAALVGSVANGAPASPAVVGRAVPVSVAAVSAAAPPAAVDREALPLPPTPPFPGLGLPTDTPLPHTGLYVRPMPPLPRLEPAGSLAALGTGRPYAGFNPNTDCILDHQRFDSRGTRQRYPHVCGPTRDLDSDLPAFTTR